MQTYYIYHIDPAHGWVEVSMAELRRLGIADKVSGFSTRLDEVAYLEEDDDYDLFCKAKAARGETVAVKKVYREYNPVRQLIPVITAISSLHLHQTSPNGVSAPWADTPLFVFNLRSSCHAQLGIQYRPGRLPQSLAPAT